MLSRGTTGSLNGALHVLNIRTPCYAVPLSVSFFFFNDTATTEIYTLSLHDALPISRVRGGRRNFDLRLRLGGLGLYTARAERPARSQESNDQHGEKSNDKFEGRSVGRSEEHTSELQSRSDLVCRLLLEKKKKKKHSNTSRDDNTTPVKTRSTTSIISARSKPRQATSWPSLTAMTTKHIATELGAGSVKR